MPFSPGPASGTTNTSPGHVGMFGQGHLSLLLIYIVSRLVEYALRDKINAAVFGRSGPRPLLVAENHWLVVHGPNVFITLFVLKLLSRAET
jgi:hypothetical protein